MFVHHVLLRLQRWENKLYFSFENYKDILCETTTIDLLKIVAQALYLWRYGMKNTLHIYTPANSSRLQYILDWILTTRMGLDWQLHHNLDEWINADGAKISYDEITHLQTALHIKPQELLKNTDIAEQQLNINRWKHSTVLFYNQPSGAIPFDIFSACFYLISRYEEYLPFTPDKHGRFPVEASAAAQFSFLEQPVVDEWIEKFAHILQQKFGINVRENSFTFEPSYDIDLAWRYLHKESKRNVGGYLKDIITFNFGEAISRSMVLSGMKQDPFYCFDALDEIHRKYDLHPRYFFLLGKYGKFDKNVAPEHPAMQFLIQKIHRSYPVGIHPSYGSHTIPNQLEAEINSLEKTIEQPIKDSRQHFIKFNLPDTYQYLIKLGIEHDYSMGYAAANGFRAGTCNPFSWYDLSTEQKTGLTIHPFAFMDATAKYYNKTDKEETFREWERLFFAVKKVNGTFSCIWHNYILSDHKEFKGWRKIYERCLKLVVDNK